ncbi:zinc-ribbon domain-containing protein [Mesobacillus harenae]|uniref:zinc-ribbon domain-containing protein n=1 Tax=Mesobacillus harenae TaxID=2213203 RepID=UPI00158072CA|nr:zinc ribbon domain-containing protein [Mesobacillus harenae]
MLCESCHEANDGDAKFCTNCGASLQPGAAQPFELNESPIRFSGIASRSNAVAGINTPIDMKSKKFFQAFL